MDAVQLVTLLNSVPVLGPYAVWLPVLVVACAALDAYVPQPAAGSVWVWPRRVIAWCALNVAFAKNAIPAGAPKAAVAVEKVAEEVIAAEKSAVPVAATAPTPTA